VTDGQTDRQTDKITITNTVQRRASHGKNVKWTPKQSRSALTNKCPKCPKNAQDTKTSRLLKNLTT